MAFIDGLNGIKQGFPRYIENLHNCMDRMIESINDNDSECIKEFKKDIGCELSNLYYGSRTYIKDEDSKCLAVATILLEIKDEHICKASGYEKAAQLHEIIDNSISDNLSKETLHRAKERLDRKSQMAQNGSIQGDLHKAGDHKLDPEQAEKLAKEVEKSKRLGRNTHLQMIANNTKDKDPYSR